jgi:tRNA nucleotidyltransferase/poly(A) polymerase
LIAIAPDLNELLDHIRAIIPSHITVYLVGGAVRDILRGYDRRDLDFALDGDVLSISRRVANALAGAYYPLDTERETGRVILSPGGMGHTVLDFAAMRGPDLESDLRARDFTINAMALRLVDRSILIDPLGGAKDLKSHVLRACSPVAFESDPVRILRAVRIAVDTGMKILPETNKLIRQSIPSLARVSPERMRDELFRILDSPQPVTAIRLLDIFGALAYVLPELPPLHGIVQSAPHTADVWNHTLDVIQRLDRILKVLALEYNYETAASWALGLVSISLGRYREQINRHFSDLINPNRTLRALLLLAALYHDVGKAFTPKIDDQGRIRFFEHELVSAQLVVERARQLRLSNEEIDRLGVVTRNHMRPLLLAQTDNQPTRRAIYRYFRATGPVGVDIALLSLADTLATYGPTLPQDIWTRQVEVVRILLEAWWERPEESVSPEKLITGSDLMDIFDLAPGPQIGKLLELTREAQATGQIHNREQALVLIRKALGENDN